MKAYTLRTQCQGIVEYDKSEFVHCPSNAGIVKAAVSSNFSPPSDHSSFSESNPITKQEVIRVTLDDVE